MNEREIADWEREIEHAKMMQEQRKGWTDSTKHVEVKSDIDVLAEGLTKANLNYDRSRANTRQAMWLVVFLVINALIVAYLSWGGL